MLVMYLVIDTLLVTFSSLKRCATPNFADCVIKNLGRFAEKAGLALFYCMVS